MAVWHARHFDAVVAFAIKDHVAADREALDRSVQFGTWRPALGVMAKNWHFSWI